MNQTHLLFFYLFLVCVTFDDDVASFPTVAINDHHYLAIMASVKRPN